MHDALREYEPDVEVVDVDESDAQTFRPRFVDAESVIARSRVPTKDLDVHVQLDDGWHRMTPDGMETACGARVDMRYRLAERNGRQVEHPLALCQCWTDSEWRKADDNWNAKFLRPYDGPRREQ
jgi:hypothetical protein